MKLERIFVEQFRQCINSKLKSQFTTQNKKVQKRKIKKLKKKEHDQEREREERERNEREEQQKNQPEIEGKIQINNDKAIEILTGNTLDEIYIENALKNNPEDSKTQIKEPKTVGEIKQNFQDVKDKKKKNKKNKKKGKQAENQEDERTKNEEQKEE